MLNYILVPVKGDIEVREFDPSAVEMFDIAAKEVGSMHVDFTCFDQPPFVVIADDGNFTGLEENTRMSRFTRRGTFFGSCIIIKASPEYKSRSDYSGLSYISREEAKDIISQLEGSLPNT